ncbi:hypothetical protein [Proteiniphilum sp. X52]|uniref:hypothetical protein n=1 Tax=Proteiniphilum sp. X52 TaxID=2382159 RepID=UPI000F0A2A4C|nr:hypothetical protein [Proteiniphilum sp. X52]RNC63929.1 hypothetical protein D7D25_13900 [Proteiniphilum sp. X52]
MRQKIEKNTHAMRCFFKEITHAIKQIAYICSYDKRVEYGFTVSLTFTKNYPKYMLLLPAQLSDIHALIGRFVGSASIHQFMGETDHDVAVRVWSGQYSVDKVATLAKKDFRLINLPFYMISGLPEIIGRLT